MSYMKSSWCSSFVWENYLKYLNSSLNQVDGFVLNDENHIFWLFELDVQRVLEAPHAHAAVVSVAIGELDQFWLLHGVAGLLRRKLPSDVRDFLPFLNAYAKVDIDLLNFQGWHRNHQFDHKVYLATESLVR